MATPPNASTYDASQIQMLRGMEAVRENMGMYLGGNDVGALHHLIYEVVDNSVDEALAGHCDTIIIELRPDGSVAVIDNGRGIPTGMHPVEKRSALELALTELHAGGKFKGSEGYKVSGGLHGVGVSAVNAVSSLMRAEIKQNGKLWVQEYRLGVPQGPVKAVADTDQKGTTIIFKAADHLFTTTEYSFRTLANRFREMAYLTKGLRFKLIDLINDREVSYYFDGGIVSFVRHLTREKGPLLPQPFYVEKQVDNVNVEVTIQYCSDFNETLLAFTNNIANPDGGTHVTGFRTALTRTINAYGRNKNLLKEGDSLSGDDVREGLTAIISVKLFRPQFESQTKVKLATPEAKSAVETALNEALGGYLEENPAEGRRIIEKALLASRARDAARKARDLVQRKGALEGFALPGKLADCSDKEPAHCELFLVEGDSAGGSAKQGRDRRFQAILPLRGKILNVEKARLDKMLANNEVKALITAMGTGIGETFDITRLRYHRLMLMADADVDGSHIRTLLLTFFFRHMRDIIEGGHLYIAQPPLYRVQHGKTYKYVYNEADRDEYIGTLSSGTKVSVQRFKGLGEMNPEQLWETTLNPQNRMILQVTVEDAMAADETFTMLMGDHVPPRRRFIQTHAAEVKNLDI
ncbi:MAG: DNA topoisomerase (ATP-hydrolyzing) subunit B [Herpetosiphonaceae bacterium]|nr:DNA topoisomerase (ATP-hydrolyzing) subunit B [Herpetosiphonaceae bacterium]